MPLARGFSRTSMQLRCFVTRLEKRLHVETCRAWFAWILYSLVRGRVSTSSSSFRTQPVAKPAVFDALFSWGTVYGKIGCVQ